MINVLKEKEISDDYININECRACRNKYFKLLYSFNKSPLITRLYDIKDEAINAKSYPLQLIYCKSCGLVQLKENVKHNILYDNYCFIPLDSEERKSYILKNAQYFSERFKSCSEYYSAFYESKNNITFVDIGCHDGMLLKNLPAEWIKYGIDFSEISKQECDGTYILSNNKFDKKFNRNILKNENVDIVNSSFVLQEIDDIYSYVENIWSILKVGGLFYIEQEDFKNFSSNKRWDYIHHLSKSYFTKQVLIKIVKNFGFDLVYSENDELYGTRIIKLVFKKILKENIFDSDKIKNENMIHYHDDFVVMLRAHKKRYSFKNTRSIFKDGQNGLYNGIYGYTPYVVNALNNLLKLNALYIIDEDEKNIGKYVPGTGTQIVHKDRLFDGNTKSIVVMNPLIYNKIDFSLYDGFVINYF